jgi:phosphoglycerol transferase MdoB-like AlkP superfamily enzyme
MKLFVRSVLWLASIQVIALFVFYLFRLVEFITLHAQVTHPDASALGAFVRGVWFDNVIACYIMVLPLAVVLIAAMLGWSHRRFRRGVTVYFAVLYAIAFMPSAANTPYFNYFFKNINSSIFEWFGYTATTAGMLVEEKSWWLYIALYLLFTMMFVWALLRLERFYARSLESAPVDRSPVFYVLGSVVSVLLILLCVFGIRGRRGYNPIKISEAYYCDDPFLNQLGINPAFNLLTSVLDDMKPENEDLRLMPSADAVAYTRQWLGITGKADSIDVLRRFVVNDSARKEPLVKPNVVVILMESMSGSLLREFGQSQPLTPTLDSLYQHSLAFTNFYSAGIHTNHGMTATLYSFPALMFRNLMKGTVTPHRHGLPTVLKGLGYENMFFMTHEAQYDNMKAFFATNGYDDIYSQENYPKSEVVNSFGVSDHFEFGYALGKINEKARNRKPFLATILTISNHPPYIVPAWFKPRTKDKETQIVEYADWCIGDFLRKAAREPWFKNTIFVIQADHGKMVGQSNAELPVSYNHIPLIIFGKGVKPMKYDGLGMQVDVMPTLLGLMGVNYSYGGFGVDLLRRKRNVVFYSADNQIVARDSAHCFVYNPRMGKTFCYDALPGWKLRKTRNSAAFKPLRSYVFSMEQTAQCMLGRQKMQ